MSEHPRAVPTVLNNNGGWCWFQDERAIMHHGKLWVGSVASGRGAGANARVGNIELAVHDFGRNTTSRTVLHPHLEEDDHDAPALYARPDGSVLAVYGKHSTDRLCRWRIMDDPGDPTSWRPEETFDVGDMYCFSNVYSLADDADRLFNFHRGRGSKPIYLLSDDHGDTWRYGGKLLHWKPAANDPKNVGGGGLRPYVRYASNHRDTIHFVTTEDHPRGYDNSIYHGSARLIDGQMMVCHSDGRVIGPLAEQDPTKLQPTDLTRVFEGGRDRVAWTVDLRLDADGHPVTIFSTQRDGGDVRDDRHAGGNDLRYHYARFDGERWTAHEIAHAGSALYAPEVDYPGLAAIHPYAVDHVYISTNADPVTGQPLVSMADRKRHYEIFAGHTVDGGKTWAWSAVTKNSAVDNIRPLLAPGDPVRTPLLWLRGKLKNYRHYDLEVVMLENPPGR